MNYADKLGVPYVVFLGDDEIKQDKVSLKNMRSGEQELIPTDQAVDKIIAAIGVNDGETPILDKGE